MKPSFLLMLAVCLPGACSVCQADPFARALASPSEGWVVRSQSPDFYSYVSTATPASQTYLTASAPTPYMTASTSYQTSPQVYAQGTIDPFATQAGTTYPAPITQDPWAGGSPYAIQGTPQHGYSINGVNGVRPRRYGWESRYDVFWIPSESTSNPNSGDISILGVDVEAALTENFPAGSQFTKITTPQFNYRSFEGPEIGTPSFIPDPAFPAPIDLPGGAYRFGLGLALQSATVNGWTYEVGVTPAVATDFRSSIDSDAIMVDGHAVAYWQMTPKWMWQFGVQYWDRVDDIIIPRAGIVYRPNGIWEFRLLFPESRVSTFLGTPFGIPTWAYVNLEYHVEAYQMKPKLFASDERAQFEDWRLTGGLRWETGPFTAFAEAGWIFDRNVEFDGTGADYDIDDGFIGRIGFRY